MSHDYEKVGSIESFTKNFGLENILYTKNLIQEISYCLFTKSIYMTCIWFLSKYVKHTHFNSETVVFVLPSVTSECDLRSL